MSALTLRQQLKVARAVGVGMEIEPHEVGLVLEDLDKDHEDLLVLAADLAALRLRLDVVRRRLNLFLLLSPFAVVGAHLVARLFA